MIAFYFAIDHTKKPIAIRHKGIYAPIKITDIGKIIIGAMS